MAINIGLPVWYRVKLYFGPAGQQLAMIQKRVFLFFAKDHVPAVNANRRAKLEFIDAYQKCVDALEAVERTKDDNQRAIDTVSKFQLRKGISQWYEGEPMDREEELPDPSKEFEELKKKFLAGKSGGRSGKLPTPDHATRSAYHLNKTPLPHEVWDSERLSGINHHVEYDPNRGKRRDNRNQNQNQRGNQNQKGKGIHITLDDD